MADVNKNGRFKLDRGSNKSGIDIPQHACRQGKMRGFTGRDSRKPDGHELRPVKSDKNRAIQVSKKTETEEECYGVPYPARGRRMATDPIERALSDHFTCLYAGILGTIVLGFSDNRA